MVVLEQRAYVSPPTSPTSTGTKGFGVGGGLVKGVSSPVLRSSEHEPSLHQVELPTCNEVLMYARVASLADSYRIVDQHFDFNSLVGLSRVVLEGALRGPSALSPGPLSPIPPQGLGVGGIAPPGLVPSHRPIINSFLDCGEDLVLEAFLTSGVKEEEHRRVEVAIFSSQMHRQFIVSYRGTTDQQIKPVRTKHVKQREDGGGVSVLHSDHQVRVHPAIKTAYFAGDMENKIFDVLNKLAAMNPFFDVVTTGHSFGAMLATVGAVRYASQFSMMRVSTFAFGCPRVGGSDFRELANSLPNLKVVRLENSEDPFVSLPEGSSKKWAHVGHSIVISPSVYASTIGASTGIAPTLSSSSSTSSSSDVRRRRDSAQLWASTGKKMAVAYKFDKKRPSAVGGGSSPNFFGKSKSKRGEHSIMSYVNVVERFTHMGLPWVTGFAGEERGGVSGSNRELRHVV